jgi:hypothetical protein
VFDDVVVLVFPVSFYIFVPFKRSIYHMSLL